MSVITQRSSDAALLINVSKASAQLLLGRPSKDADSPKFVVSEVKYPFSLFGFTSNSRLNPGC